MIEAVLATAFEAPITFSSLHTLTLSYLEEQIDDDNSDDDSDEGGISDSSDSEDEAEADTEEIQMSEQDRWERDAIVGDLGNFDRCRIIFPKLEYANIYNTPGNAVLNSVYAFPERMSMIYIYNSFPALKLFAGSGIKSVKSTEFYFTNIGACDENGFYRLTSNFFEPGNIDCEYSKISVPRTDFAINWSLVNWGTLQHLVIGECFASELSRILEQCPRVEDIKMDRLIAEELIDSLKSKLPPGLAEHIMHISKDDDLCVQKLRLAVSSAFLSHSVLNQIKVSECTWKKKGGVVREKRKGAGSNHSTREYDWSLEM
ncbi:hypothetical protein GGI15_002846 [Coemansia interrupta]|uniref:Uncharacterized protein n=1 Tax=Coemansia interrupta TaxID=1126814 RepID=A0A9W8LJ68_9FUNG|nr:hypothetical protein GGI15_002846 [Coemansia interrupta]